MVKFTRHPLLALLIGGSLSTCLGDNSNGSPRFVCVGSGANVCLPVSVVRPGRSGTGGVLFKSLSEIGGTAPLLVAAPARTECLRYMYGASSKYFV